MPELRTSLRPLRNSITWRLPPFIQLRRALTFSLILVFVPPALLAQRHIQLPVSRKPAVEFEPINLISEDPTKSRLDINYRIPHNFFIFTRNRSEEFLWPFIARADITVEVFDKTNTSVAREILTKEIGSEEPPARSTRKQFLQGIFSFELPPGEYRLHFEIDDLQSSRRFIDRERKISLRNFQDVQLGTSDFSFIEPVDVENGRLQRFLPFNLGGNVLFGRDFDGYIEFTGTDLELGSATIQYHLRFYKPETGENVTIVQDTVSSDDITGGTTLEIERSEASYYYYLASSSLSQKFVAIIKFDGQRLRQGRYNLEIIIKSAQEEKTIRRFFDIRWADMPLSLRDIDFAISAMRHLIGDEVDKWLEMSEEEKRKLFNAYWMAKDETPETALNKVQEEYFRRADHAYTNFSTLRRRNGIESDRGKIFMLYGPPTKTERKLVPKRSPQEVWYYESIGKMFIFEDSSRGGDYELIRSEPL